MYLNNKAFLRILLLTNSVNDRELYKAPWMPNIGSQKGISTSKIIADRGAW